MSSSEGVEEACLGRLNQRPTRGEQIPRYRSLFRFERGHAPPPIRPILASPPPPPRHPPPASRYGTNPRGTSSLPAVDLFGHGRVPCIMMGHSWLRRGMGFPDRDEAGRESVEPAGEATGGRCSVPSVSTASPAHCSPPTPHGVTPNSAGSYGYPHRDRAAVGNQGLGPMGQNSSSTPVYRSMGSNRSLATYPAWSGVRVRSVPLRGTSVLKKSS